MIDRLITWSLRNRRLVLLLAAALAAFGVWAALHTPVDAIPDLSENQVLVHTTWTGHGPEDVERQVTAPLAAGLRGIAGVSVVRTTSEFGTSMIDAIFEGSVPRDAARSRVADRLAQLAPQLPPGAAPLLAPDATAVGQVFWYTVEGPGSDLGELRAVQDTYVRPHLQSIPGVAEVATAGGARRELQVEVHPDRLATHEVTLSQVEEAVARASATMAGGVMQDGSADAVLTGRTAAEAPRDIENAVVVDRDGSPVLVRHIARVQFGMAPRRCILEKDGREAVGGVVVMRHGGNPRDVIRVVRRKIEEIAPGLPAGVRIVPFYDRTDLVDRAIGTITTTLFQEVAIACVAILLVMGHVGGAVVVCLAMPLAVLFSLGLMWLFGIPSNIMSLAGIAISVGVLVDQAIVLTDNAMHHLRRKFGDEPVQGDIAPLLEAPAREVGRPLFFSVLIMVLSFLPVFALRGIEGRMYFPLAATKTFALCGALLLTVTVLPAALPYVLRGRIRHETENPLVRTFIAVYRPVLRWLLPRPGVAAWIYAMLLLGASAFLGVPVLTGLLALAAGACAAWFRRPASKAVGLALAAAAAFLASRATPLGSEFMPPLDEGAIVDMPVTVPRVSMTQVADDLKARDALLRTFPEAAVVVGKAGRAETATDPAPLEMVETLVGLRPREEWPRRHVEPADVRKALAAAAAGAPVGPGLAPGEELVTEALRRVDADLRDLARAAAAVLPADAAPFERLATIDRRLHDEAPTLLARAAAGTVLGGPGPDGSRRPEPAPGTITELEAAVAADLGGEIPLRRKTREDLVREMDVLLQVPGWANIWTQPIVNRIDMMATGIRTPLGVKVFGPDLTTIQRTAERIAEVLRTVPGAADVVVDQGLGRSYLEVVPDREKAAAYGVRVADVALAIDAAGAGRLAARLRLGREEVPVRVRYAREFRDDARDLRRHRVSRAPSGPPASSHALTDPDAAPDAAMPHTDPAAAQPQPPASAVHAVGADSVPLSSVATLRLSEGPAMIRGEDGLLCVYVQCSVRERDLVGVVEDAREAVRRDVAFPEGVHAVWGGQYEHQVRAHGDLALLVPAVLLLIALVLYLTYRSALDVALVLAVVPGALAGGVLLQALWGERFSVAVWVGYIACLGMAVESGIIMLVYIREAIERRGGLAAIRSRKELREAVVEGAVLRQRPKLLTELTTVLSLVPMLWVTGAGSEVTSVMALPVLGGILVADEVVDVLLPIAFLTTRSIRRRAATQLRS